MQNAGKAKVLVVDDSPFVFKAVRRALEPHGYQVVGHAVNGKIGLEMIRQYQPDIITLDVTMPVMDGLAVAAELEHRQVSATILLSAMGDMDLIKQAQHSGIKRFLTKPFQPDDLLKQIMEIERERGNT